MQNLQDVTNAGQAYSQSIQQGYDIEKMLTDALAAKYSKDNPLIKERQTRVQDLLQAPEQAQQEFGQPRTVTIGGGQYPAPGQNPVGEQSTVSNVFFSPAQQRALLSQRMAAKLAPVTTLDDILLAQYGGGKNIIDAVTKAYGAQTERKKAEFDTTYKTKALEIAQYKATKGRAIPSQLSKAVADYNSISSTLQRLKELGNQSIKEVGPVTGRLGLIYQKLRGEGNLKTYEDERQAFLSNAAKGLGRETGVLTNKDVARAASGLADPGETATQFRKKQAIIDSVLNDVKDNLKAQFRLQGIPFDENYLTGDTQNNSTDAEQLILDALGL